MTSVRPRFPEPEHLQRGGFRHGEDCVRHRVDLQHERRVDGLAVQCVENQSGEAAVENVDSSERRREDVGRTMPRCHDVVSQARRGFSYLSRPPEASEFRYMFSARAALIRPALSCAYSCQYVTGLSRLVHKPKLMFGAGPRLDALLQRSDQLPGNIHFENDIGDQRALGTLPATLRRVDPGYEPDERRGVLAGKSCREETLSRFGKRNFDHNNPPKGVLTLLFTNASRDVRRVVFARLSPTRGAHRRRGAGNSVVGRERLLPVALSVHHASVSDAGSLAGSCNRLRPPFDPEPGRLANLVSRSAVHRQMTLRRSPKHCLRFVVISHEAFHNERILECLEKGFPRTEKVFPRAV